MSPPLVERAAISREHRPSAEGLLSLLEHIPAAAAGIDSDARVTLANRAFAQSLGFSEVGQVLGRDLHGLLHAPSPRSRCSGASCPLQKVLSRQEELHSVEDLFTRMDGTFTWAQWWLRPAPDAVECRAVFTFVDATGYQVMRGERDTMWEILSSTTKRAAMEMTARFALLEQLRQMDRLKTVGTLASGVAHELGTPLSVVLLHARMIHADPGTSEQARESAWAMAEQAELMTRIVRQLLDFARPRKVQKAEQDVSEVVTTVVCLLDPLARKRNITLSLVPSGTALAQVDITQIQQAITNLVVNAIDASAEGAEVVVSAGKVLAAPPLHEGATPSEHVRISVCDTGAGISSEDLPRIFEPFFTTKDVGKGNGLGLPIAYGIAQDHGGWISVETEMDKGSCFSLFLPSKEHA